MQGARQVGKTWILQAFGAAHFRKCVLLDFAEDPTLNGLFQPDLKPARILTDLNVYLGQDVSLDETLLIFDDIQLCPKALTSLKYFYAAFPEAHICASGSLLGLGLSQQDFPVGKVQREWLRPMSFFEFLEALGENLLSRSLADSYFDDIAKHAGSIKAIRIASLFKIIPQQLARETNGIRKFLFKDVVAGRSTYDVLAGPIEWLIKAGLVHRVPICRNVKFPMSAFCRE